MARRNLEAWMAPGIDLSSNRIDHSIGVQEPKKFTKKCT